MRFEIQAEGRIASCNLEVNDCGEEYLPFMFPGFFDEKSACYLRYSIRNGQFLGVVSQLPKYLGTDITSGFKEIVESLTKNLLNANVFSISAIEKTPLQKLADLINRKKTSERHQETLHLAALKYVSSAHWVACYPPGVGLSQDESFALVRLDKQGNYKFDFRRKKVIAEFIGVAEEELDIDFKALADPTQFSYPE